MKDLASQKLAWKKPETYGKTSKYRQNALLKVSWLPAYTTPKGAKNMKHIVALSLLAISSSAYAQTSPLNRIASSLEQANTDAVIRDAEARSERANAQDTQMVYQQNLLLQQQLIKLQQENARLQAQLTKQQNTNATINEAVRKGDLKWITEYLDETAKLMRSKRRFVVQLKP